MLFSYICFSHTQRAYTLPMEKMYMDKNELLSFLRLSQKLNLSLSKPEQIQNLINEFEMNIELRNKGLLSLDGMWIFLNN